MPAVNAVPDEPAPQSLRDRLLYPVLCRLIHRPVLLRALARLVSRCPAPFKSLVVRERSVVAAFARQASFSSIDHLPDMPTGRFAIGMENGPEHDRDRALLERVLPTSDVFATASLDEARNRIGSVRSRLAGAGNFDLVNDYMTCVVWMALRRAFGPAAAGIEHDPDTPPVGCPFARLFGELRYVGAHLIGGSKSPVKVKQRAQRLAASLEARVAANAAAIAEAWQEPGAPIAPEQVRRNAVGLMWVGHPATVQAGALIMQELLDHPIRYLALRVEAGSLGDAVWTDAAFREKLRAHVIEMLRFRPPFPILTRRVMRDTAIDANGRYAALPADSQVTVMSIGAMFDPAGVERPDDYWPGRPDKAFANPDDRYLMFGYGERICIARAQVVEMLASAFTGLLTLPELGWADRGPRIRYDGPIITEMLLAARG